MRIQYTHEVGVNVRSIAGEYEIEKESEIRLNGERIFFTIGRATMDASCCGPWGCRFALVHGYVRNFKMAKTDKGLWISELDPIRCPTTQRQVKQILARKDGLLQVQFR